MPQFNWCEIKPCIPRRESTFMSGVVNLLLVAPSRVSLQYHRTVLAEDAITLETENSVPCTLHACVDQKLTLNVGEVTTCPGLEVSTFLNFRGSSEDMDTNENLMLFTSSPILRVE